MTSRAGSGRSSSGHRLASCHSARSARRAHATCASRTPSAHSSARRHVTELSPPVRSSPSASSDASSAHTRRHWSATRRAALGPDRPVHSVNRNSRCSGRSRTSRRVTRFVAHPRSRDTPSRVRPHSRTPRPRSSPRNRSRPRLERRRRQHTRPAASRRYSAGYTAPGLLPVPASGYRRSRRTSWLPECGARAIRHIRPYSSGVRSFTAGPCQVVRFVDIGSVRGRGTLRAWCVPVMGLGVNQES